MVRGLARFLGLVIIVAGGALAVIVVGVRLRYPPVVNAVRHLARDVGNPQALKTAGKAGDSNALLRHVGRTSGKEYETPVTAIPVPAGFVVSLPYGATTDWARNVLAAGTAMMVHDGETHTVERPEIVPLSSVEGLYSARELAFVKLFGVQECIRLHTAA